MRTRFAFVFIFLVASSCFTDVEEVASFYVINSISDDIELTFTQYQSTYERNYEKVDTSFLVERKSKKLVYNISGLVLKKERYRDDTNLIWFDSLIIKNPSNNKVSEKRFEKVSEWAISNGKYGVGYELDISEEDF